MCIIGIFEKSYTVSSYCLFPSYLFNIRSVQFCVNDLLLFSLQVTDLYTEIRQTLGDIIFCISCQKPLSKQDTMRLMAHLRQDSVLNADGSLDSVSLILLVALWYCFDVSLLQNEDSQGKWSRFLLSFLVIRFRDLICFSHWKIFIYLSIVALPFINAFVSALDCSLGTRDSLT